MKLLIAGLVSLAGVMATAETLHTCVVVNHPATGSSSTKTVYIANGRGNIVRVSDQTVFDFAVPLEGMKADVSVVSGGEYGFDFSGDIAHGQYATNGFDSGSITCDKGIETAVVYVTGQGQGETTPAEAGLILSSCYAGSGVQVAADIVRLEGFSEANVLLDPVSAKITATRDEQQCIKGKGKGTNVDDYECEKYGTVRLSYTIPSCDYHPEDH